MTTPEPRTPVVAIGDVHGCATLLREAIWPHLGSGAELILLGDLIDRSPEPEGDRQVIELVRELQANPDAYGLAGMTVLRGNHEQMLLDALAEQSPGEATDLWEWNGGNPEFLAAAPVTVRKDEAPAATQAAITNVARVMSFSEGGGLIQTTSG